LPPHATALSLSHDADLFFSLPSSLLLSQVPPKKAVPVAVNFKAPPDAAAGSKLSGKLTVSAPDGFTQLYYLQGEC
jgi:hypothetical protein